MNYYTLPDRPMMEAIQEALPSRQPVGFNPFGLVYPEALSPFECEAIVAEALNHDIYSAVRCGAVSRELPINSVALEPLRAIIEHATSVDDGLKVQHNGDMHSWMQEYGKGGDYHRHMDSNPGSFRKLSCVVMLSPRDEYDGGHLIIEAVPEVAEYIIPREQGTVVVFHPMLIHHVTPVMLGKRRTLNVGLFGDAWR
jgi:hypothetical protein